MSLSNTKGGLEPPGGVVSEQARRGGYRTVRGNAEPNELLELSCPRLLRGRGQDTIEQRCTSPSEVPSVLQDSADRTVGGRHE